MGLFSNDASIRPLINGRQLNCMFCGNDYFNVRMIKLNSTGMELFDMGWANRSSTGLICSECGYVHEFLNDTIEQLND